MTSTPGPRLIQRVFTLLALLLLWSCGSSCRPITDEANIHPHLDLNMGPDFAVPRHSADTARRCSVRFRDIARQAGINYEWKPAGRRPLSILGTIGNGCAFLDYNHDGNLDLLLVSARPRLYRGDGRGSFQDVTRETGLDMLKGTFLGCAVGDYDNDGFDDIYLSGYHTGLLLHNEHGKGFKDVTAAAGIRPQPWGTSCAFADVDGDGRLDLYIADYVDFGPDKKQVCETMGIASSCGPNTYSPIKGVLYRNTDGHHFSDVSALWGLNHQTGKTLGAAFADFDDTGHPGLYTANDETKADLFENRGRPPMHEMATVASVNGNQLGQNQGGMGVDWGDYDNDGRLDLFVATFSREAKCLYHNDGNGLFKYVSDSSGIEHIGFPYVTFGCKFLDADNDGWLDLLIANGHVQDNITRILKQNSYRQPVLFMHNTGAPLPKFEDASRVSGLGGLPWIVGRGLAVGDFDNDGRTDAVVVDSEGKPLLLHNETPAANSWVGFRLVGAGSVNCDAYGAVLTVSAGGLKLTRQCQSCGSYLSASDSRVHFGTGTARTVNLTIRWPDGKSEVWTDIATGRYYTVRPGARPH